MQKNDEIKRLCLNIRISFARGLCHLSYFIILEVTYRSILWELNGILPNKFHCINVKSFEHNIKNLLQIPHVVASPPTARQQHSNNQRTSGSRVNKWEMCWAIASSTPSCLNKASAMTAFGGKNGTEKWSFNFRILERTHHESLENNFGKGIRQLVVLYTHLHSQA